MPQPNPDRSFAFDTVPELAKELKVSEKQVRRWIKSGELVAHRFGRQLRIEHRDKRAFIAARRMV